LAKWSFLYINGISKMPFFAGMFEDMDVDMDGHLSV
jgi:hypothetical protein